MALLVKPEETEWLKAQAKLHHCIVEIGTFRAETAIDLAKETPGKVYTIDDFPVSIPLGREKSHAWRRMSPQEQDAICAYILEQIKPYPNLTHLRMTSEQAAQVLVNEPVDMVWIDGDHSYEAVLRELQLFTRMFPNALICGHDLDWIHSPGVRKALDEFGRPYTKVFPEAWLWYLS